MKVDSYVDIIQKTSSYPTEVSNFGVVYVFLGLLGEKGEFLDAVRSRDRNRIVKEAGDCVWYTTAACKEWGLDANTILHAPPFDSRYVNTNINDLAEPIKKYFRDGKPLDKSLIIKTLIEYVGQIKSYLRGPNYDEIPFEEVLETNYNKLIKRLKENKIHGEGDNR